MQEMAGKLHRMLMTLHPGLACLAASPSTVAFFSFDALEAGDTAEGLFDFVYGKREILGVTDLFLTPWTLALVRWICKFALFPLVERLGLSFV